MFVGWTTRLSRKSIGKKSIHQYARKTLSRQEKHSYGQHLTNRKTKPTDFAKHASKPSVGEGAGSVACGPREIVIEATTENPAFTPDNDFDFKQRVSSFESLGLRDDVLKALDSMQIRQPTVIQMVTVPDILQRKHVISAAQTGSGKTLAYLAPIVHHLREDEDKHGIVARLNRPRACVVVPARELAMQVLKVAKSLSHYARFRSIVVMGGRKKKLIRGDLEKPVDLIVATPGTLLKYRQRDKLFFTDLTHLVIDEADTMFDSSFKNLTLEILQTVHVRESKPPHSDSLPIDTQVTIVGATLPNDLLASTLATIVPHITKCTSGLHRVLPHVQHKFIKIGQNEKADKLIELLQRDVRQGYRTIVFCNTASACNWLGHYLDKKKLSFILLHGDIPPESRCQHFEAFQKKTADLLICTDIASRGLDTCNVTHVINFDFPNSLVDYIHRVGRTGRVSHAAQQGTCHATSFVSHNRDARMAQAIQIAAKKNASLDVMDVKRHNIDDRLAR